MFSIDNASAAATKPAKGAAGTQGYFTGGDPVLGVPATVVTADFLNMLQDELKTVILNAGLTPDKADDTQLDAAIRAVIAGEVGPNIVPQGNVLMNASEAVPTGYLHCDGSELDKTTYADLYAAIGNIYSEPALHAGSTFRIPDYRGYFPRFWSSISTQDPDKDTRLPRQDGTGGNVIGSQQADELKSHTHTYQVHTSIGGSSGPSLNQTEVIGNTGATGGAETRPKNIYFMAIIKY